MLAMPHDMVKFSKMPAIFDHFCLNLICIPGIKALILNVLQAIMQGA